MTANGGRPRAAAPQVFAPVEVLGTKKDSRNHQFVDSRNFSAASNPLPPDADPDMDIDLVDGFTLAIGRPSRRPQTPVATSPLGVHILGIDQIMGCDIPSPDKLGDERESDMRDLLKLFDVEE